MMRIDVRLTLRVVAAYCHVSKSTVMKWIEEGKLQAFKLPGGHYRIDKDSFRSFLAESNMPIKKHS